MKTKAFVTNFVCSILERQDAITFESTLKKSLVRCYTDGSKINGRVGAGFYIEYPGNLPAKEASFHLGKHSTVFQAEIFALLQIAKELLTEKMQNQTIVILADSQAAIKALEMSTVTSITVLNCINNLNELGKDNGVLVTWTPAHTGIPGNERADFLAKAGSSMIMYGPEPFITVPYASCVTEIKDWSTERWRTLWRNKKDCLRTKENVGWTKPRLSQRLIRLKRPHLNQVLQVLTGHCNLQRHKRTTHRSESSLCPKCGLDDETPDHHVGTCAYYEDIRNKYFGNKKATIKEMVNKYNISKLAAYLKEAGRLAEYDH